MTEENAPVHSLFLRPFLLCVLSGILCFLSFPPLDWGFLAWGALVPYLYAISPAVLSRFASPYKTTALLTLVWGFTFYGLLLYWTSGFVSGGVLAPVGMGLLCAVCLVPLGLLCARRPLPIVIALSFTAFDWIRSSGLFGFTWGELGYTQYAFPAMIQIASVTGVFGITFLIVFFNAAVVGLVTRGDTRSFGAAGLLIVLAFGFGHYRLLPVPPVGVVPEGESSVRFAAIQGNFPPEADWEADPTAVWGQLLTMSAEASDSDAAIVVWSETVLLAFLNREEVLQGAVAQLADELECTLLVGAPALEVNDQKRNSLFLFVPGAGLVARYDKLHLVPFGEMVPYVPPERYRKIPLAEGIQDFYPGEEYRPLRAPGAVLGPLICYEGAFDSLGLTAAESGATVLVNVTNDAWSGYKGAHEQHFALSVLRAVETGVPLFRCGNTGISAYVDRWGRIVGRTNPFERTVFLADVAPSRGSTPYGEAGNLFAMICFALAVALQFSARPESKKEETR